MRQELFNTIRNFKNQKVDPTIINEQQIDYLVLYAIDAIINNIDGDFVEFGCYVGESSKFLRNTIVETKSDKDLYVYDSFEGLPNLSKYEENTGWRPRTLATTEEILISNFRKNNLKPPIITKGWFKEIPDYKLPEKISFAFLDGDFYESIYDSLSKIYDKVSDGGYILFHDYDRNDLPGVKIAIETFFNERGIDYNLLVVCDQLGVIQKNSKVKNLKFDSNVMVNNKLTIVTGLWDINRLGRDFTHYIDNFKLFLDIPQNLFIYIESKYEHIVWEKRDKSNTFVKTYELSDIKKLYEPHWDKTQEIRTNPNWVNLASWLGGSPQASLEWYNPIVQSKMFMLNDASIWNPFDSEYLFWLDAGITNTVPHTHFVENNVLDSISNYGNPFLFLSYPYEAANEIHGFEAKAMNMFAGADVKYVCRGGLFGGHKDQIRDANSTYYSLLQRTLNSGYMGTEESLFTIMSYNEPEIYQRYELDGNGLIVKFTQAIIDNNVKLAEVVKPKITNTSRVTDRDVLNYKTNLYMLTFNFPKQILHTIKSMEKTPEWLTRPNLVLLDNSTNEDAKIENKKIAEDYNFEYVDLGGNTGICGGRQAAAEHFDNSDSDFMFFFEDDMTVNPPEMVGEVCRNGFMKYVPNLYNILHKIMLKDGFDFVKLTFTEVYFDNDKQCSWYNVPQNIRSRDWPNYDKLPVTGLDPNAPLTNFKNIRVMDGVSYIDGEVYYANWPMIVSKSGNKKMFIDTKWAHPYEQTWMSHMYQMTKEGDLKPAILLAAPIWHDRIMHYTPEERREN
jgi:O-methyltransferase